MAYPNPPAPGGPINLRITGFGGQTVQILLTDAGGRRIARAGIYVSGDSYIYSLKRPAGMAKGAYVVTVSSGSLQKNCTLIVD